MTTRLRRSKEHPLVNGIEQNWCLQPSLIDDLKLSPKALLSYTTAGLKHIDKGVCLDENMHIMYIIVGFASRKKFWLMALIEAYFNNVAKDLPFKCRQKRSFNGKFSFPFQRMGSSHFQSFPQRNNLATAE